MNGRYFLLLFIIFVICSVYPSKIYTKELKPIQLLPPQMKGGRPLMEVLKDRKSQRNFSSKEVPPQMISNLLWAAFGVNRPNSGKRTAPSAVNWQEIDIYIATTYGLYLYDAFNNMLIPILQDDIRDLTGNNSFVKNAPINLVYVADYSKMGRVSKERKDFYSATDAGFISQNVYLYCASEGLATVVRGAINRDDLSKVMKLGDDQKIILAQTVGYPEE